ncbi:SPAG9 family protein [Megaselia abdita]
MDNGNGTQTVSAGAEIVYGTDDNHSVMSEKVQQLAGSIYQEFEKMIHRYDEDVVKTLMPLLVNVLECLDTSYRINQEQDVELELLREDNEQLVTQYEREKNARKMAENKLLETEDIAEQENKDLASRLESLESIVRMLELKHKNSLEHASRLEERESELKKEYNKLHERYTELFKNHVDYMERTKMLMGSTHSQMNSVSERLENNRARLNPMIRSSGPVSYGFASLDNSVMLDTETICSVGSRSDDDSGPPSLQNELDMENKGAEASTETDKLQQINQATSPQSDTSPSVPNPSNFGRSTTKKEQRSANTLYQELSFQDNEESEENELVTGCWVHPGDYASSANDNYFGMGKEVENLIMENNELLATKNALNIVKDDLIVKVDELTGDIEILREELNAVGQSRNKLRQKISELEEDLKKTKEQVKQQNDTEQEESDVPMAQRKRFTRVEMAMVLMERNQYKERLMELQEAVRFTAIIKAKNVELDKKSKQGIWKYFSNLFSAAPNAKDQPGQPGAGPMLRYPSSNSNHGSPSRHSMDGTRLPAIQPVSFGTGPGLANALCLAKDYSEEGTSDRASARRREQYRQLRAHVQKDDGRLQAYGWSLPITKTSNTETGGSNVTKTHAGGVPVPVPVFCNPLAESSSHMKVYCASGVNLNGGYTKDGGCVVGASIFYSKQTAKITEVTTPTSELETLDRQITMTMENTDPELQLSSYVWVCTSTSGASTVTVLNANDPGVVLDAFPVCTANILCISTVVGALEKDYVLLENSEIIRPGEMLAKPGEGPDDVGLVEFIRVKIETKDIDSETVEATENEEAKDDEAAKEATDSEEEIITVANDIKVSRSKSDNVLGGAKRSNPILGTKNRQQEPPMSSIGPTMWLGSQDGHIYVHSAVGRWHECLHKVKLPDAILGIIHVDSRVVVAMANGQLAIFRRQGDGQWDLNSYHLLTLGDSKHSIRCLTVVADKVWAAHRNKIFIVDPLALTIVHTLEAHPRKESQVRQLAATGLGVWVSIRLDSTLRLYHAHTFEHIQDVDIEPYVSKMLGTGKLGFSFVRITAMMVSCNRLWIGTSNGVVISVPLSDGTTKTVAPPANPSNLLPRCCMANAQLSFHGHRDAVKFFVAVPMSQECENPLQFFNKKSDMLVMCGGEGYIDFRLEKHAEDVCDNVAHLIVWRIYKRQI